jgi:hypothetical protein
MTLNLQNGKYAVETLMTMRSGGQASGVSCRFLDKK